MKALGEGAWKADTGLPTLNGFRTFAMLGLTERDDWKAPAAEAGKDSEALAVPPLTGA